MKHVVIDPLMIQLAIILLLHAMVLGVTMLVSAWMIQRKLKRPMSASMKLDYQVSALRIAEREEQTVDRVLAKNAVLRTEGDSRRHLARAILTALRSINS